MDLKEAKQIARGLASGLETEEVEIRSALGRILAEDVSAGRDIPAESRSRWDGFAFVSRDSEGAELRKPVLLDMLPGEATAGKKIPHPIQSGQGCRIMTGAVLPEGADTVIPFEDAAVSRGRLVLTNRIAPGSGVIASGADAHGDDIILEKGDILTPTRLALIVTAGGDRARVVRRPRVAILATGDELLEAGSNSDGPFVFCDNIHLLANLVTVSGGEPAPLGIAPDDPEAIASRLENAGADMVITTGGMGKGSRDFILEVWKRLGIKVHFDRLNLSPGRGSALGSGRDRIFLGLPGNPRAGRIVFEEIATPILQRFLGVTRVGDFILKARNTRDLEKKKGFYRAFEGHVAMVGHHCEFIPHAPGEGPMGGLSALRNGLAYALAGPEQTCLPAGDTVEVKIPDLPLEAREMLRA